MVKVNFYELGRMEEKDHRFVVIMANYDNKWIVVRHKERTTWEIPGGHIEDNEEIEAAAARELFEETGAKEFELFAVSTYSVGSGCEETFGRLYFAKVKELGKLPGLEIEQVRLVDKLPDGLTYPLIQPYLWKKVIDYLEA